MPLCAVPQQDTEIKSRSTVSPLRAELISANKELATVRAQAQLKARLKLSNQALTARLAVVEAQLSAVLLGKAELQSKVTSLIVVEARLASA